MTGTPSIDEQLARFPLKRVSAGERAFSYREAGAPGNGAPLVLLHGIGSNSGSWLHQLNGLSRDFYVVAWDAPGYGESSALQAEAPTASDYAEALREFADALHIDRFTLVGHSLGALMASAFAAQYSERLRALMLLDPAGGYGRAEASVRAEKLRARLAMMEELGPQGLAEKRSDNLVSTQASPEARELVRWAMRRLNPAGHAQAARMLANGALDEDAARFQGRALVACGSADTVTPETGCKALAQAFAHAEYRTLPDLGHASYVEAPAVVNSLIREFAHD